MGWSLSVWAREKEELGLTIKVRAIMTKEEVEEQKKGLRAELKRLTEDANRLKEGVDVSIDELNTIRVAKANLEKLLNTLESITPMKKIHE